MISQGRVGQKVVEGFGDVGGAGRVEAESGVGDDLGE